MPDDVKQYSSSYHCLSWKFKKWYLALKRMVYFCQRIIDMKVLFCKHICVKTTLRCALDSLRSPTAMVSGGYSFRSIPLKKGQYHHLFQRGKYTICRERMNQNETARDLLTHITFLHPRNQCHHPRRPRLDGRHLLCLPMRRHRHWALSSFAHQPGEKSTKITRKD